MTRFRNCMVTALFFLIGSASVAAEDLVSFELVRKSLGSIESRLPYEPSTSVREGDRLELASSNGLGFGLTVTSTQYSDLGNRIIRASTDAGGKALLVVGKDGELLGNVMEMGERHRISTSADGQRRIFREGYLGQEKRIDDGGVAPEFEAPASQIHLDLQEEELSSSRFRVMRAEQSSDVIYPTYKTGTATISVLMYYDDSMSNAFSVIDFITQLANDAFVDSGSKTRIEIVGTKALDIDDDAGHYDLYDAMREVAAPFEEIREDRRFFSADVIVTLRDTEAPDGDDPCGLGSYGVYKQYHSRSQYIGLVQWGDYCADSSFAHEVGHILGAAHNKEEEEFNIGAYSYSNGYRVDGVFRTIMSYGTERRVQKFSSPALSCFGYECGVDQSAVNSADSVSTFHNTGHLIASNEGPFAYEAISTYATRGEESTCTTSDETEGFFRGIYLRNQSRFPIEVVATHFGRPDGTFLVSERDAGEFVVNPGGGYGWGFCREAGEDPVMGTTYDKAFHRYLHPETGQIVESTVHEWDNNYEGEYRQVRVASGQGGSVSGNPAQSVRVGSSRTFTFTPDNGYALADIESTCTGRKSGNSYTVDVGQDNCFVEATFQQVAASETLRLSIETPASGLRYSGIGTFQGWAVAQEGIDRVDLYVDGVFFQSAPYGGSRGDVGNIFPDVPGSRNSGYALAFNYGDLSEGTHTLKAIAVTENGRTLESSVQFSVAKFHKPFIGAGDTVSLDGASCSVQDSYISVIDAVIDDQPYDVFLEWRTGTQGFEIYRIR